MRKNIIAISILNSIYKVNNDLPVLILAGGLGKRLRPLWPNIPKGLAPINQKPFLGWGASTFPYLNSIQNSTLIPSINIVDAQHTHNILLELAHNFGIPLSIIISATTITLLIKNLINIKNKKISKDIMLAKTWLLSSFLIVVLQITDITYYDGKISLLTCILFAGLRCMLNNDVQNT